VVEADTGLIGGSSSHEFIILADNGEDKLVFCPGCEYSANFEMSESSLGKDSGSCIHCGGKLKAEKGIEIGHIFKLGTKYSDSLDAKFVDIDGKLKPLIMGCYGIGITRMLAAAIEQQHDSKGIIWPVSIAPFMVNLIVTTGKNEEFLKAGDLVYRTLTGLDVEVLYDDREVNAGIKFKDSDLIGIPIRFILGRKFLEKQTIDVEYRKDGRKMELPLDSIPEFIKKLNTANNL